MIVTLFVYFTSVIPNPFKLFVNPFLTNLANVVVHATVSHRPEGELGHLQSAGPMAELG